MMTVKEIAELTGISARTLHYYDEIGLFVPTSKSEAGYRLYDDKALETLQQILFFREFDIPLKEIKVVMENPDLDRNQILQMQRKMLVIKKERMERLINSIDDILKGDNKMDFAIFSKTEVEEMFQTMIEHMPENIKNLAVREFGSVEEWKKHYIEVVSSEEMQKGYAKVVEWYGGKEKFLSVRMKVITGIQNAVADCQTHKAVHDKYIKIGWKVRQAAYAESHKDELDTYNKAFRYLKKQGVDLNVNLDALQAEYDKLQATHTELAGQLATVKEELQPMKDIRYWVGKVLTPEQATVEKKPEPKHSPSEQIKFYQEQEKQKQEQKIPQQKQKKQNMEL